MPNRLELKAPHIAFLLQAVEMFLDEKIGYLDIVKTVEATCEAHKADLMLKPSLEDIVDSDAWARRQVKESVDKKLAVAA